MLDYFSTINHYESNLRERRKKHTNDVQSTPKHQRSEYKNSLIKLMVIV